MAFGLTPEAQVRFKESTVGVSEDLAELPAADVESELARLEAELSAP